MKIAVIGANGTLGRAVIERAATRGHEIVAVTRGAPKRAFFRAVLRSADVATGEGITDAITGVDAIVNAVNTRKNAKALLVDGTKKLLEAAERLAIQHYVGMSVVGLDRAPLGYYMIKLQEEAAIEASKVPWSLLRATQFHNLVDQMFSKASSFGVLLAPPGAMLQPIDVADVATTLVEAIEAGPSKRLPDLGGPEIVSVRDLAKQWLKATRKTRVIMPTPVPGALGKALRESALCTEPDRALGKKTFADWCTERYAH